MKMCRFLAVVLLCLFLLPLAASAENSGRIYGEITTVDGDVLEGLIRWDKNEGSWVDMLDGSKELRDRDSRARRESDRDRHNRRKRTVKLFGLVITDENSDFFVGSGTAQSGIRFGHIRSMEIIGDDRVLLELKSGLEVELFGGSTDIGSSIREIIIEDLREGEIELDWDDIKRIDFTSATTGEQSVFGERLYGTLETRRGDEYTGFICWDIDELFTGDVLDGEERNRNRKIRFSKIAGIERYSSKAAEVLLTSGDEIVLRGTNDVNSSNRGILVCDPGFGQVQVEWDEFEKLVFSDPPSGVPYDEFDGGRRLEGTVFTEDGDSYSGMVRWDDDEEYTWEILDGEYRNCQFDIEFGLIRQIEKRSYRAAVVTVWDGREFRLRGSNDVDADNKGIYITLDDGDEVIVDWEDFERVEFVKP